MIVSKKVIAVPLNPDKSHLVSFFPKHKVVTAQSGDYLVVPRTIEYALELKRLELTTTKLTGGYKYPGRFKPYTHQIDTTEFMVAHPRAFCLNDMGTGKTASCIWAAEFLRQAGLVKRVLIVSLISCMKSVWDSELFGICPQRYTAIAYGSPEYREQVIFNEPDYVIINPDGIKIVEEALKWYSPDLIIIDEASAYKHPGTKKYKALKNIVRDDTRIWMLTATPAANSPADVYGLIKLVNPMAIQESMTQFKNRIMTKISNFKWVPKSNAVETVMGYMRPAIRYDKKDCLDMPPVTYIFKGAELSKEQAHAFEQMKNFLRVEGASETEHITAVNAAAKMTKLLQICLGVVYDDEKKHKFLDASPRIELLDEILEEAGDKCIIFVPFKGVISSLEKHLSKKYNIAVVTGDTSLSKRSEIFRGFQHDTTPQHLLAHPQTTSHGLNLTRSHNTIWYGPIYNTEFYIQANNRSDRPGQTHPVTITHIFATELERKLYAALRDKQKMQDLILDLYSELTR